LNTLYHTPHTLPNTEPKLRNKLAKLSMLYCRDRRERSIYR